MSTIDRPTEVEAPPLFDGQRLDRVTFHELYGQCPDDLRFELIGGVVHMVFGAGLEHGILDNTAGFWLGYYESLTPGTGAVDNASVFFEDHGEPQPDTMLIILPEYGGRTRREGRFLSGGPELVVEISQSSLAKDLGPKLADYERAGVLEYVVAAIERAEVYWHERREGKLIRVQPGGDGWYRSEAFPGLWLDPEALLDGDKRRLIEVVNSGVASPEHAEFLDRLVRSQGANRPGDAP